MDMNSNKNAPIVIFAFNRLDSLKECVSTLQKNSEATESDLFVFVDGPREIKEGEKEKVEAVRQFVMSITGFKSLTYFFSKTNNKLGPSIIAGVSEVINKYGRAIVLEDDLLLSPNVLSFMNQALEKYENCKEVFSVCGYSNRVSRPNGYQSDFYFCTRSSSWGWATWADRWNSVDWNLKQWNDVKENARRFCKWGGSDCWKMLNDWHRGKNQSWAIRFCYAQFVQNKFSLFPMESLILNEGFDGNGTNSKRWSRFKFDYSPSERKVFSWPEEISIHPQIYNDAMKYHGVLIRIWSRVMYLIH